MTEQDIEAKMALKTSEELLKIVIDKVNSLKGKSAGEITTVQTIEKRAIETLEITAQIALYSTKLFAEREESGSYVEKVLNKLHTQVSQAIEQLGKIGDTITEERGATGVPAGIDGIKQTLDSLGNNFQASNKELLKQINVVLSATVTGIKQALESLNTNFLALNKRILEQVNTSIQKTDESSQQTQTTIAEFSGKISGIIEGVLSNYTNVLSEQVKEVNNLINSLLTQTEKMREQFQSISGKVDPQSVGNTQNVAETILNGLKEQMQENKQEIIQEMKEYLSKHLEKKQITKPEKPEDTEEDLTKLLKELDRD